MMGTSTSRIPASDTTHTSERTYGTPAAYSGTYTIRAIRYSTRPLRERAFAAHDVHDQDRRAKTGSVSKRLLCARISRPVIVPTGAPGSSRALAL